jgi:hypothetical protein
MLGVEKEQPSKLNVGDVKGIVGDVESLVAFHSSDSFLHDVMGVSGNVDGGGGSDGIDVDGNAGSIGV